MPKVSVVMPAYNAEKYIREAIDSILNQTFTDFEFIIVNDGATDRTKEIIQSYDDPRIVYLENEKNSGIVVTLNKGLDTAKGEYIARMDADDIATPERLKKQVDYLDNHANVGILGCALRVFGDGILSHDRVFSTNPQKLKAELLFSCCVAHPTVMMRRSVLEAHKLRYDENFSGAEDYHLWWRMAQITEISTLTDVLHYYRIHKLQITQDKSEKYVLRMKKLLDLRLSDLALDLSENEEEHLLNYCLDNSAWFTEERVTVLCDILERIVRNNYNTGYFDRKALIQVMELAVIFTINNSKIEEVRKKEFYRYAVKCGLISNLMRLKMVYHYKFIG